ncbi:MAG: hypothetical protein ACRCYV_00260 [Aeromonas sp.]
MKFYKQEYIGGDNLQGLLIDVGRQAPSQDWVQWVSKAAGKEVNKRTLN